MYVKIRETLEEKDKEEIQTSAVGTGDPLIPKQETILEQR